MFYRFEAKDDLKFNIKYGVFTGNKVHAPFGVQYILDSVVSELLKNKHRRYVKLIASLWYRDLITNIELERSPV